MCMRKFSMLIVSVSVKIQLISDALGYASALRSAHEDQESASRRSAPNAASRQMRWKRRRSTPTGVTASVACVP